MHSQVKSVKAVAGGSLRCLEEDSGQAVFSLSDRDPRIFRHAAAVSGRESAGRKSRKNPPGRFPGGLLHHQISRLLHGADMPLQTAFQLTRLHRTVTRLFPP